MNLTQGLRGALMHNTSLGSLTRQAARIVTRAHRAADLALSDGAPATMERDAAGNVRVIVQGQRTSPGPARLTVKRLPR